MNTKTLYFIKRIAFVALFAMGFLLLPTAGTALAQKGVDKEVATTEMLSYALNLGSVSDVAIYSENGVSDKHTTLTDGYRARWSGAEKDDTNRKDLAKAFSSINQLPCKEIADTDLSGKTYGAGVYCLSSAELSSRLILDGENNPNAVFVFRIAGALNAKSGSSIGLVNDAQASSVFFVSNDSATVGEGVDFKGNILARNSIGVGKDAMVDGRVLSVKGDVALSGNSILGPQQTGILEICKRIDTQVPGNLANRVFRFQIGNLIAEVPAGQCSGPLVVPTGPQVITELQTGRQTDGNTFNGNFQLTGVSVLGQTPTTAITSRNLPAFTTNVNIREGNIDNQTRLQFTNQFAITAIIEICKEAIDSGVTGFFNFTVNELRDGAGNLIPFTVPVGQCTNRIAVVVASNQDSGPPRRGTVTVNEQARTGFLFTSATTALGIGDPTNRLISFNVCGNLPTPGCSGPPTAANPNNLNTLNGGGNVTVVVVAGEDGGITDVGATARQTTIFFNNRSAPAQLKVCKIAGPGIAELSIFNFTVTGSSPLSPITTPTTLPGGGTAQPGATLDGPPFVTVTRNVSVLAGPVANGGFCQVVPGTFVVDTLALITEAQAVANLGEVRVSRIRSSSGIIAATGTALPPTTAIPAGSFGRAPGVPLFPLTGGLNTGAVASRSVVVPVIREVAEVEFVNIAFLPVPLKICKVAGAGVAVGTPFTFTVTADTAGGLLAPFSRTVTVLAGPASTGPGTQNGFCDFAGGQFGGTFGGVIDGGILNGLGSFNLGSTVTIQETGFGTTVIAPGGITSPTGGVIANLANRTALISGMIRGVNEVQFVNQAATAPTIEPPPTIKSRKRARFF